MKTEDYRTCPQCGSEIVYNVRFKRFECKKCGWRNWIDTILEAKHTHLLNSQYQKTTYVKIPKKIRRRMLRSKD